MIRLLTIAMLVLTAFAVNTQAAQCDDEQEACHGGGYCHEDPEIACSQADAPSFEDCGGEVCAYGEECAWCSGPMVDDNATRGPEDGSCENCRTLTSEAKENAPGLAVIPVVGAITAALVLARRK